MTSTRVGTRLNLRHLALSDRFRYEPELMSSAIFEHPEHRGKAMVYASGAVLIAGQRSFDEAVAMQTSLHQELCELGVSGADPPHQLTVRNIVGVGNLRFDFDLKALARDARAIGYEHEYDPVVFAGLRIRVAGQRLLVVIFSSGKYTVTGARNLEDVESARSIVEELVRKTRVGRER